MYTFTPTQYGTVEVFQDGKRISTTTPQNATQAYGYTGQPLASLPGTPPNQATPQLPTLPQNDQPLAPADTGLPQTPDTGNNLVSFKDTLSQVADLARQKRNALSTQFLQPLQGTLAASDFNGILSNLNTASDTTVQDYVKNNLASGSLGSSFDLSGTDYSSFLSGRTPEQTQAFNSIPDGDKATIAQLINGDALISDVVKSRGVQGNAQIKQLINEATAIDPTFSINSNKVRFNFMQKWNDPNGASSKMRNSINTALGHLADFKTNANALAPSDIQFVNKTKNWYNTQTGSPGVLQLQTDINALASEVATIYKGGTQPTEKEISDWANVIAANFSKGQFTGVSNEIAKLLSSKITATRYQYKQTMGQDLPQSLIDPDKRQALIDVGIDPNQIIKENVPAQPVLNPDPKLTAESIGQFESGGNYHALGPNTGGDRAYGKYQIMGSNIPAWTKEVLGKSMTPEQFLADPQAQDAVAQAKLGQYIEKYGNLADAASAWFTGGPASKNGGKSDVLGTTTEQYIGSVNDIYNRLSTGGSMIAAPNQPAGSDDPLGILH